MIHNMEQKKTRIASNKQKSYSSSYWPEISNLATLVVTSAHLLLLVLIYCLSVVIVNQDIL